VRSGDGRLARSAADCRGIGLGDRSRPAAANCPRMAEVRCLRAIAAGAPRTAEPAFSNGISLLSVAAPLSEYENAPYSVSSLRITDRFEVSIATGTRTRCCRTRMRTFRWIYGGAIGRAWGVLLGN
jgi:hypothetical protein